MKPKAMYALISLINDFFISLESTVVLKRNFTPVYHFLEEQFEVKISSFFHCAY